MDKFGGGKMNMMPGRNMGLPTVWLFIIGIMVLAILIMVIFITIKLFKKDKQKSMASEIKVLDILNERLAKGEITEEEYTNKRKLL